MHDFQYRGGRLYCEGVALDSLARKYGTPLYVYSQNTLTEHFRRLDRAMAPVEHLVCFAVKSNSNAAILRALAGLGSGFDIVSGGELERVIAAGGDPRRCVFAGVGKSDAEIKFALEQGVYSFNAESEPELERINRKPFRLAGFDWDYSGTVLSWNSGVLEGVFGSEGRKKVFLRLIYSTDPAPPEHRAVQGDRSFSSGHPAMQKINPHVYQMIFIFRPRS